MRPLAVALTLLAPLAAQDPAAERPVRGFLDLGFRSVSSIGGDFRTYRSVVDLGEGPKLLAVDLFAEDPSRALFDRMIVAGYSWGGDPYNTARVDVERSGTYRLLFDYRNVAYFNALPSFASTNITHGAIVNQRSFDMRRRFLNAELELRPGKRIVPFLAYGRDSGSGSGVTPFVATGNEYPLATLLRDQTDYYRGGVRFEFPRWHVTLEQGGAAFKDDQSVIGGPNAGNRLTTLLGRTLRLDGARQLYGVRGDSVYARGVFTASPAGWADLYGHFLFSQPRTEVNYSEEANGLFWLGAARFLNTGRTLVSADAKQPHPSGSFSLELRPHRRVRILESVTTDRLHNATSGLLAEQLLLDSVFTTDRLVVNFHRQQVDAIVELPGRISLRGGHRYTWGDALVRAPVLGVTGQPGAGELRRHVGLAGLHWRPGSRLSINADFEGSSGAAAYFRTSLQDYRRLRLRGRLQLHSSLEVGADLSYLSNDNPAAGAGYQYRYASAAMNLHWSPSGGSRFRVLGEYAFSSLRSDIGILVPPRLERAFSRYRDNGHVASLFVELPWPGSPGQPLLTAGGSFLISSGSRPTRFYQPSGRLRIPVHRVVRPYFEWRWYGYTQPLYGFEGFRTHHVTAGMEFTL